MSSRWHNVWSKPTPYDLENPQGEPTLRDLIAADGYNTGFGTIGVEAWSEFVDSTCSRLDLKAGDTFFDVGCGAGAFLQPAAQRGILVGGLDYSASRIDLARRAMPDGQFEVGDANDLDTESKVDVVISVGVFFYFPSHRYAEQVIERMCRKASRAVAICDIVDVDLADAALEERQARAGGPATYAERYEGLDHLAYSQSWIKDTLEHHGMVDVAIEPQSIRGYDNGKYRFNAWAWKDNSAAQSERHDSSEIQ